ncbi:DUF4179 domain-containing protein [Phototrophicus methaneseepsis]|uniref:DUF4179 domain-containing protein n=1 Tax=Phototrophicus methaneseepsis TaxID=2710758 RepID=A0A7S8IDI0_9CHLR|nr:DUF4179 domain-containing protein [Phototrophicus methaneseepsis]QPC80818.1 DUF4179 domain-containing protein [Phototrophicus methaneseepsis]
MNENTLHRILDDIGKQNIPQDVDIYPAIEARLTAHSKWRFSWRVMSSRLAASVLIGVLFLATTVYAVTQLNMNDPGLQENMVTVLGLSQTVDDMTVTLDWAYADANRIVVGYSVRGDEEISSEDWRPHLRLTDSTGRQYQPVLGFGANWLTSQKLTSGAYFDALPIENTPESLDLRLSIQAAFVFDFTVPFVAGVRLEGLPPVEVAGLQASLEWAIIAPSMTRTYICYEVPDDPLWAVSGANVELSFDDIPVAHGGTAHHPMGGPRLQDGRQCQEDLFLTTYNERPQTLTLTIISLHTPHRYSQENMHRAAEILGTYGIEADVILNEAQEEESYMLNIPNPPLDEDLFDKAWEEAMANMGEPLSGERINGPWQLQAEVPKER